MDVFVNLEKNGKRRYTHYLCFKSGVPLTDFSEIQSDFNPLIARDRDPVKVGPPRATRVCDGQWRISHSAIAFNRYRIDHS